MKAYEQVMRGAQGLINASNYVTRTEFHDYVMTQDLSESYPGIQGIGFNILVPPSEMAHHTAAMKKNGFPDYAIRPAGARDIYTAIVYLEPANSMNQRAIGFDTFSEPVRRKAMEAARDSGKAAISGKITLVQESNKEVQAGVLMFLPVYKKGAPCSTVAERRDNLIGWISAPFRMGDLMSGTLGGNITSDSLRIEIHDGDRVSDQNLLYSNSNPDTQKHPLTTYFQTVKQIRVAGRPWMLEISSLTSNDLALKDGKVSAITWLGVCISVLLAGLSYVLLATRNKAVVMAREMTKELRDLNAVSSALGEKLGRLNQRFSLAADSAGIGVWELDLMENRLIWDKWMNSLYGLKEGSVSDVYETWKNCVHPDDRERGDREIQQALRGEKDFNSEFRVVWPSGEIRHIKGNGFVLRDADGKPLRMIGVNYDITANKIAEEKLHEQSKILEAEVARRQRAQEELAAKQVQLENSNNSLQEKVSQAIAELRQKDQVLIIQGRQAAMGEMIGNIAHQWRQPLNALAILLGNIQLAYQYEELNAEYLKRTVENGNGLIQKMSSTINDFRNFFKPDKKYVCFAVLDQVRQAIALIEAGLKNLNIAIQLDVTHTFTLKGFPNEYSQVLLNLLLNARDAVIESGVSAGKITVHLHEQDGNGCVAVRDNGGGIPAEIIERIFEPYFSTKNMGTGIGLYMSKMIIERSMDGVIEVHNSADGADFVIVTPLATGDSNS